MAIFHWPSSLNWAARVLRFPISQGSAAPVLVAIASYLSFSLRTLFYVDTASSKTSHAGTLHIRVVL